ncbi:hypothetical protein DPMN_119055 [Dreissena polymorpha]|uniref:Uncharacterized protein n=1 Tax=Dreissena polymorpha TaxID=45954 RepID=A0A9D4GP86_DREPO|nr:hypothetical protein DPMN_119055 [Dreissena polymorpha]
MTNYKVFGRTDGLTDRQTDGRLDGQFKNFMPLFGGHKKTLSYANDDDDGDENDDHDAAAAPPPMLLLMMMMLIMFNITTAFEHRCRSCSGFMLFAHSHFHFADRERVKRVF